MTRRRMTAHDKSVHWSLAFCAMLAAVGMAVAGVWFADQESAIFTLIFVLIFAGLIFTYPVDHGKDED